jgi:hypothetical protein
MGEPIAELLGGDCLAVMPTLPEASVETVLTDPPYELGFMGKRWDSTGIAFDARVWRECLRVAKPRRVSARVRRHADVSPDRLSRSRMLAGRSATAFVGCTASGLPEVARHRQGDRQGGRRDREDRQSLAHDSRRVPEPNANAMRDNGWSSGSQRLGR